MAYMVGIKKRFKKLVKLYKRNQKSIKKFGVPLALAVLIFFGGMLVQMVRQERSKPANIVWAIDETVKVPAELKKMLLKRDDCRDYRSAGSPKGVGLWAVVQVEQGGFAKITHGCSWAVNNQALAVKQQQGWQLVPAVEYFSDTLQGVPSCTAVVKYKVPIALEGFCLNDTGKLSKNPNS